MKIRLFIVIPLLFLFSFSVFAKIQAEASNQNNSVNEQAIMEGSILQYTGVFVVNNTTGVTNGRIPGSYANLLKLSRQSKYTVVGENRKTSVYARFNYTNTEAADGKPHYVEISHVGVYRGKDVNIRINVENMLGRSSTSNLEIYTPTSLTSGNFLRLLFRGANNDLTIRYEFIDNETGELIDYKGTWILKRLNSYKNILLNTSPEHMKTIFAMSNSAINYRTEDDFNTTLFSSTNSSVAVNNTANQMMYSFDAVDGYVRKVYIPNKTGRNHVYYDWEALAAFDVADPNIIGKTNEDYPKVSYKIVQDYPKQKLMSSYPKRFKMTVQLDKILKMDAVNVNVSDLQGNDVTNLFTISIDEENAKLELDVAQSTLSSKSFVNNTYTIEVESEIDWKIPFQDYVQEDGYFHIPASVKVESDVNNTAVAQSEAKTKYIKGCVRVYYLIDDGQSELVPMESFEGEIGESYLFEPKQIPKYKYIKTIGETSGIFEKDEKVIQFIYEKIPNKAPILSLEQESTEEVAYEGGDFKISGQVSDADSPRIHVFYTLDSGQPIEIARFEQDEDAAQTFDFEAVIAEKFLKDGRPHTIKVFAVDDEEASSKVRSVSLAAFVGVLQFKSIPKEVIFDDNAVVSTKEEVYYITHKSADLLVEDTRINSSSWQVSVQLVKPLTSESGVVLDDAVRYDEEVIQYERATKIFEQTTQQEQPVNISKDWIEKEEGLNLVIPPIKATAERYETELQWVLEDIPEN